MAARLFDIRLFAYGGLLLCTVSGRCFGGESNTVAAQTAPFEVLAKRVDAAIKNAETNENARRDTDVRNQIFVYAIQQVNAIGKLGDRAAIPFLEEKSFSASFPSDVRARAASAYVKIADLGESIAFMKRLNADPSVNGRSWRYFLNKQFLDKIVTEEKNEFRYGRQPLFLFVGNCAKQQEFGGSQHGRTFPA